MSKIRNAFIKMRNAWQCYCERRKLRYTDFSIISNNCWGGLIYQKFGLRYTSPTIGLFFFDEDYLKFVERLDHYLSVPLSFIDPRDSVHYDYLYGEHNQDISYPVARLGDIEVFFMHYHSREEAESKWRYRTARLNRKRLLVKFSQRHSSTTDVLDRFATIDMPNKLCFTPLSYTPPIQYQCRIVQVTALERLNMQGGDETPYTLDAVDICEVINCLM